MIEHDMDTALDLADRITVLHYGSVIVEGTRAEVVADPEDARGLPWPLKRCRCEASTRFTATATCCTASRSICGREGPGAARPQRRRQDHVHEHDHRLAAAAPRQRPALRRADRAPVARGDLAQGRRLVPQGRRVFPTLTVQENLLGRRKRRSRLEPAQRVFELFRAQGAPSSIAGSLSGGEQQMLAIGRALMGNPRVLLMDEPSEGLAPIIVAEVGRTIARLKAEGQSILLVEQNVKLALRACRRCRHPQHRPRRFAAGGRRARRPRPDYSTPGSVLK
jgi:ABC-type branched-subunit amino acid transport system ATPase component